MFNFELCKVYLVWSFSQHPRSREDALQTLENFFLLYPVIIENESSAVLLGIYVYTCQATIWADLEIQNRYSYLFIFPPLNEIIKKKNSRCLRCEWIEIRHRDAGYRASASWATPTTDPLQSLCLILSWLTLTVRIFYAHKVDHKVINALKCDIKTPQGKTKFLLQCWIFVGCPSRMHT